MNLYQHAFLLSALAVWTAYVWRTDDDGGLLYSFLTALAAIIATGYVTACPECQDSGSKSLLSVRLRKYSVTSSGCWNWTGKQNADGYGVLRVEGKYTRAHRATYFAAYPDADKSKIVMHKCDNPRCINLEHLQLGTQKENMMDMHQKGRFKGGAPLGNKNALGNKGWTLGGATSKYASKLGGKVDVPDELI